MAVVHSPRDVGYLSYLPLDRPIPSSVLEHRRHAFSNAPEGPEPYDSNPRMLRRGAVSYEQSDVTARYIRFLGDAVCKRSDEDLEEETSIPPKFEQTPTPDLNLNVPKQPGRRRGSLLQMTASSTYKETHRYMNSVIDTLNVDVDRALVEKNLASAGKWSFDIFAFRRISEGRPLFHMGFYLIYRHNLVSILGLDNLCLMKFMAYVEEAYHPDNCYHNSTHAADVTQALNCLLLEPKLFSQLTHLELLAALLAAMCHDMDHPGVNQNFLVNTSNPLARIHGTHSTLERHHCQQARAILRQSKLLECLPKDQEDLIHSLMDTMILGTDVNRHRDYLTHFKDMLAKDSFAVTDKEDRHLLLTMAIKVADISNPSRELPVSKCWSEHIMEEFFRQGDIERKKKLPISSFCDRRKIIIPESQAGFFEFIALPLFQAWCGFFDSQFSNMLVHNILENKRYWDGKVDEIEAAKKKSNPDYVKQPPEDGKQAPEDGKQAPEDGKQPPEDGKQAPEDGKQAPEDGKQAPEDGSTGTEATAEKQPPKP